jgi:hypothetical protein
MSQPPETSIHLVSTVRFSQGTDAERVALIDAWVRVREAEVLEPIYQEIYDLRARGANSDPSINALYRGWADRMESALATARKQLEEKNV